MILNQKIWILAKIVIIILGLKVRIGKETLLFRPASHLFHGNFSLSIIKVYSHLAKALHGKRSAETRTVFFVPGSKHKAF